MDMPPRHGAGFIPEKEIAIHLSNGTTSKFVELELANVEIVGRLSEIRCFFNAPIALAFLKLITALLFAKTS